MHLLTAELTGSTWILLHPLALALVVAVSLAAGAYLGRMTRRKPLPRKVMRYQGGSQSRGYRL